MSAVASDGSLPILTAVVNPSLEAELVGAFEDRGLGVTVVRRCVDLVELLAAAASGTAVAALVSADLRGLDREALGYLADCGVAVVGLAVDEDAERHLHQLGAALVVPATAGAEQVAGALRAAHWEVPTASDRASPAGRSQARAGSPWLADDGADRVGTVIAVWGPTGAPGRTTIALGLADALARRRIPTLLVDADPYGGSVAMLTGLLEESPGITAACRAANAGALDVPRLADCCRRLAPDLRVLTGIIQASRWPELRPVALEVVLTLGRRLADVTVVDCGFCLEDDEELSYDTLAPRRNAATLTALQGADVILAVGSSDPVGLSRLARELPSLAYALQAPLSELLESGRVRVVLNRKRTGLTPGNPERQAIEALERHAGAAAFAVLPMDVAAADAAHGRGELLSEAAPGSALAEALEQLANRLRPVGERASEGRKPLRLQRIGRRHRRAAARA